MDRPGKYSVVYGEGYPTQGDWLALYFWVKFIPGKPFRKQGNFTRMKALDLNNRFVFYITKYQFSQN